MFKLQKSLLLPSFDILSQFCACIWQLVTCSDEEEWCMDALLGFSAAALGFRDPWAHSELLSKYMLSVMGKAQKFLWW